MTSHLVSVDTVIYLIEIIGAIKLTNGDIKHEKKYFKIFRINYFAYLKRTKLAKNRTFDKYHSFPCFHMPVLNVSLVLV